jgi:DNA polymerase-3 subunit epsilon
VATAWVLDGQLARYPELPRTLEELHERFATPDLMGKFRRAGDDLVFAFGKHRGRRLSDVAASDPDYLRWMREEGDFLEDVPQIVSAWLEDAASPQDVHS